MKIVGTEDIRHKGGFPQVWISGLLGGWITGWGGAKEAELALGTGLSDSNGDEVLWTSRPRSSVIICMVWAAAHVKQRAPRGLILLLLLLAAYEAAYWNGAIHASREPRWIFERDKNDITSFFGSVAAIYDPDSTKNNPIPYEPR